MIARVGFIEGLGELFAGDADVGNVGIELGEIGTKEDETKVPVGRDLTLRVALSEEAVFASLDVVSEAFSERACKGLTSF